MGEEGMEGRRQGKGVEKGSRSRGRRSGGSGKRGRCMSADFNWPA